MKKVLFLLILAATAFTVNAQSSFRYTASNPTGAFTNTAADTMTYTCAASYNLVSIQPVFSRLTGTMAGTCYLAYSVDGTNYVTSDSATLSNAATNTTVWNKTSAAKYWRIIRSGATTVTGTSAAKISAAN